MAVERKLVHENMRRAMASEYLRKEAERAGFGGVEIRRTPMGVRVSLRVARPGFIIGRKGATIKRITRELETRFELQNPQIEVEEDRNPSVSAQIMAQSLAEALERGWHFRRAGHGTLRRIMEGGAKGCTISLTGKLTGQRGRLEKFTAGHIKHSGEPSIQWMEWGYAMAKKKLGIIGVQVGVMRPDAQLPDDVQILEPGAAVAEATVEGPAAEAAAAAILQKAEAAAAEITPAQQAIRNKPVDDLPGVGPKMAETLRASGYDTIGAILEATAEELMELSGVGEKKAVALIEAAQKILREGGSA